MRPQSVLLMGTTELRLTAASTGHICNEDIFARSGSHGIGAGVLMYSPDSHLVAHGGVSEDFPSE